MIFQGLFNILSLYFNQLDLFHYSIDKYFKLRIPNELDLKLNKEKIDSVIETINAIVTDEFHELGLENSQIEVKLSDQFLDIDKKELSKINTIIEIYSVKFAPIVFETLLEKILEYLVDDPNTNITMKYLKKRSLLPIEFMMELRNFKQLYDGEPAKKNQLRKYIKIKEKIVEKLREDKNKIEQIEDFENPNNKMQLFYMIYRIIEFFGIQKLYDFTHIKHYIKDNISDWLETLPLVTLKNPDLYYCGIYLLKHLDVTIEEEEEYQIKYFLLDIYDESIDEFEAPIIEATNKVDYFFKSSWIVDFELSEEQIKELLKGTPQYFESNFLKTLETSQLVIILKLYKELGVYHKVDSNRIKAIIDEIEQRITPEGINQYREGFFSSEAAYHVLFSHYMQNTMKTLREFELIDNIVSRIYRNLGILVISEKTNFDLISELYYSCECLKLLNCIEKKNALIHIARYLFPEVVFDKVYKGQEMYDFNGKYRHLKISKITGDLIA